MPTINPQRLMEDLGQLRRFGATGNGVVRTTFSDIDMESRRWLIERMTQAGLRATIDGVGNVFGRSTRNGPCVLVGSHSDTQPTGGWLDGALGVIFGIEVVRSLAECEQTRHLAVDAVSWSDEEGSYLGMMGSRSFCGHLHDSEIDSALGEDGRTLVQALRHCELTDAPRVQYDPHRHIAYLEAHIEQGPYLEAQQQRIGVVTSIVGLRDFTITFCGEQNHAGTTPMSLRQDAGVKLIEFAAQLIDATRKAAGDRTVWTIGQVEFSPGTASIIPGRATMRWQFRDPEESRIRRLEEITRQQVDAFNASNRVRASLDLVDDSARATAMDAGIQKHLAHAADKHCPGDWVHMPSGAAHDAQELASRMPAGMLFIPSIKGISHSFEEDSHEQDIVLGCQVLADTVAAILLEKQP